MAYDPALFHKPGVFTAWALRNGDMTPEQFAVKVAAAGFAWIAPLTDSPQGIPPDTLKEVCGVFHKARLAVVPWATNPEDPRATVDASGADGYIFNVESQTYRPHLPVSALRQGYRTLPVGLVTNLDVRPNDWIPYNVKCLPMCYQQADADTTPANMVAAAKAKGWRVVFPVLGCFQGYPLSSYTRAGNGWSVYLADEMQPDDWQTAAAWNGVGKAVEVG